MKPFIVRKKQEKKEGELTPDSAKFIVLGVTFPEGFTPKYLLANLNTREMSTVHEPILLDEFEFYEPLGEWR